MIKIKFRFILTFSMFLISACAFTQPVSPAIQPTQEFIIEGLCDHPLYPVKQNATWSYSNTGNPSGDINYTETITEVHTNGFTVTSQSSNGNTYIQEWACETGGLKALQLGSLTNLNTNNLIAQVKIVEVIGTSMPKEIVSGMQWLYSLKLQSISAYTLTLIMQEMGQETVTVPAGIFEAKKFQTSTILEISVDEQGTQTLINITSTIWYAPNIGFIKSVDNVDTGGSPFTATTELQSYSIP